MNRRDYLKLAAAGSLAVVTVQLMRKFSFSLPGEVSAGDFIAGPGGRLFKGTADGRILASADGGLAWNCSVNLGKQSRIMDLSATGGNLIADIGFPGGTFQLASADGIVWRTAG